MQAKRTRNKPLDVLIQILLPSRTCNVQLYIVHCTQCTSMYNIVQCSQLCKTNLRRYTQGWAPRSFPLRTFRSEHSVLFCSFKERNVLFSFFEFLATYGTQKNVLFFSSLFRKRVQRTQCSFATNVKDRKECNVLLQRT